MSTELRTAEISWIRSTERTARPSQTHARFNCDAQPASFETQQGFERNTYLRHQRSLALVAENNRRILQGLQTSRPTHIMRWFDKTPNIWNVLYKTTNREPYSRAITWSHLEDTKTTRQARAGSTKTKVQQWCQDILHSDFNDLFEPAI